MTSIQLPAYAYIPGQNERHPEDAFDLISNTAIAGNSAEQLSHCDAFQAGLLFLDKGYYWEAHEVLEPVWMLLDAGSVERKFVQGLIQIANGYLKLRMGKPKAAKRLVDHARSLIPDDGSKIIMSLEVSEVSGWIDRLEVNVKKCIIMRN